MTLAVKEVDPEQPVVEAVLQGDRYAFGELVSRHSDWVRAVIFGVLGDQDRIDDVLQQVWTTFWEQIDKLRDPARWRPWLYRLARNAAVDAGREVTRDRKATSALGEQLAVHRNGQSARHDAGDQRGVVLEAIDALPDIYREPFVLRHLQEWSYREIADVMDLPVDTVETRLVRARRQLRDMLRDKVQV